MRPFKINVSDKALPNAGMRLPAPRWLNDINWRAPDARINAHPNFLIKVDGLQLHAVHRPSTTSCAGPRRNVGKHYPGYEAPGQFPADLREFAAVLSHSVDAG